jgi:lia operon protein LiaG
MSNTTKVVLIVTAVLVVCVIGAAITIGIISAKGESFSLRGFLGTNTIDLDESAELNLDGVRQLNIENVSGRIIVKPGEPRATLTGRIMTNTDQKSFLSVTDEGGTLTVRSDIDTIYPSFINGDMVLTVYVPEDLIADTSVSGASASTEIGGIQFGRLTVNSASGAVNITECTGSMLKIGVISGGVKAANLAFDSVEINCTSGGVSVDNVTGSVSVGSTSGAVRVSGVSGSVEINNTSGSATVTQPHADLQPIRIHNISGGIKVNLNPDAEFDLDANTTSGGFSSDFDITISGNLSKKVVGEDIAGKVNGGGASVELSTVSGGITVKKGE